MIEIKHSYILEKRKAKTARDDALEDAAREAEKLKVSGKKVDKDGHIAAKLRSMKSEKQGG